MVLFSCNKSSSQGELPVAKAPSKALPFELGHLAPANALVVLETTEWSRIRELVSKNNWMTLFGDEFAWDLHSWITWGYLGVYGKGDIVKGAGKIQGGAVGFLTMDEKGEPNAGAFVVETGAPDSELESIWTWFEESQSSSAKASKETLDGFSIRYWERSDCFAIFTGETYSGVCGGEDLDVVRKTIQGVLARAAGDLETSLANKDAYLDAKKGRAQGSVLSVYLDWQNLLDANRAGMRENDLKLMQVLGTEQFTWARGDLVLGAGEYLSLELQMPLDSGGFFHRILDHLRPIDLELMQPMPQESMAVLLANADWDAAVGEFYSLLVEGMPEEAEVFDRGFNRLDRDLGFALREGFLKHLKGPLAAGLVAIPWRFPARRNLSDPTAMIFSGISPVGVFGAKDSQALVASLKRAVADNFTPDNEAWKSIRIQKHEAFLFNPVGFPNENLVERDFQPQFLKASDHLVMTGHTGASMRILRQIDGLGANVGTCKVNLTDALAAHSDASVVVAVSSRHLMQWWAQVMRAMGMDRDGGIFRLPSGFWIEQSLRGMTTLSLKLDDGLVSVTLRAR